jgi:hypothetical protein
MRRHRHEAISLNHKIVFRKNAYVGIFAGVGIRSNEARMLLKSNVDVARGVLNVEYSKGHDRHYIVMHESMLQLQLQLMPNYDAAIRKRRPDGLFFRP